MIMGVCARTFLRQIHRYEGNRVEGLLDKRLTQISSRRAPLDESVKLCDTYSRRYQGWNVPHLFGDNYTCATNRVELSDEPFCSYKKHIGSRCPWSLHKSLEDVLGL